VQVTCFPLQGHFVPSSYSPFFGVCRSVCFEIYILLISLNLGKELDFTQGNSYSQTDSLVNLASYRMNAHIFNCDRTCDLSVVSEFVQHVCSDRRPILQPFSMNEFDTVLKIVTNLPKSSAAFFAFSANESRLSINDYGSNGYGDMYRAACNACSYVVVIIVDDGNIAEAFTEPYPLIYETVYHLIASQFKKEQLVGPTSMVISWNTVFSESHVQKVAEYMQLNKSDQLIQISATEDQKENVPATTDNYQVQLRSQDIVTASSDLQAVINHAIVSMETFAYSSPYNQVSNSLIIATNITQNWFHSFLYILFFISFQILKCTVYSCNYFLELYKTNMAQNTKVTPRENDFLNEKQTENYNATGVAKA
jgi:hypothetical protein